MSAALLQDLYDWVQSLSGEAMFLFALPFVIAALGLLADWVRTRSRLAQERCERRVRLHRAG